MNAKCYTFYSYKGGSGRTTTLLNTTKHLAEILNASAEHPILLVDADLESAGLTYFFGCDKKFTARFNSTIHAEAFLNAPGNILSGVKGDNVFGKIRDRMVSCDALAARIAPTMASADVEKVFAGVSIRETTAQILDRIVKAIEKKKENSDSSALDRDEQFLAEKYNLTPLIMKLSGTDDPAEKRRIIEDFLPADSFVDVSHYFGRPLGSVKFVGVDVHFTGVHSTLSNDRAEINKRTIVKECGNRGFSTVIFDCGAGVQSTAHVLNHVSDVIVYCMRPTSQFAFGTLTQLQNYRSGLQRICEVKNSKAADNGENTDKKSVIILPTAVPYRTDDTNGLQRDSFDRIGKIAKMFDSFVDNTFCTYENSLREVALFKWREHILGTLPMVGEGASEDVIKLMKPYSVYDSMPADAKAAYSTYRLLAERLCYNS